MSVGQTSAGGSYRGNAAFKRSVSEFIKQTNLRMDIVVRKIALKILVSLVRKSPVDTGHFRGNWFVQEAISPVVTPDTDKGGGKSIEAGAIEIARFKAGDRFYILNHLPYSIALEGGSSGQAPQGMVKITVAEFEQYFRKVTAGMNK